MKSIIEILKSPNAVLGVLALALLAQMPHAADVFRLTVKGGNANIWTVVHSYSYATALAEFNRLEAIEAMSYAEFARGV